MTNYEQIFEDSFQRVLGTGSYNEPFISYFYRVFFSKSPDIAPMFTDTNMSVQKTMLHDSLLTLIDFSRTKQLSEEMQHLARIHGRKGLKVLPGLYDHWLESIVETAGHFDKEFGEEVALSWRLVLMPGITYLKIKG